MKVKSARIGGTSLRLFRRLGGWFHAVFPETIPAHAIVVIDFEIEGDFMYDAAR
jgi:hypothetical protein